MYGFQEQHILYKLVESMPNMEVLLFPSSRLHPTYLSKGKLDWCSARDEILADPGTSRPAVDKISRSRDLERSLGGRPGISPIYLVYGHKVRAKFTVLFMLNRCLLSSSANSPTLTTSIT
jgi:hypothetical protein